MEKKKTGALNLGWKGLVIVILAFVSIYCYSALTSDSLNVTVGVFGAMGIDTNAIYSMSTVAVVCGILGSILFGKLMTMKSASLMWGICMIITAVFCVVWSQAHNIVAYAIGYLVCYTVTLAAAMLLSFQVIANWFPKKRGVALGIATAAYPLSAASTANICGAFVGKFGGVSQYYIFIAIIALIVGIIVLVFSKDFPENKGVYPDNNKDYDFAQAEKEYQEGLEYLKTSKWTVKKCFCTWRTWHVWIAVSITAFLSMGIMSNFFGRFLEGGYSYEQIQVMIAVAGVIAIPGSVFIGWLDVKIGTKKAGLIVNILGLLAVGFNLTQISILHYISLPFLALMLGGSSNMLTSCTSAIWGRYDFQNAFRVIQPLNAIMTGVGITVVGIIGTNVSYYAAYVVMFILAIIGVVAMIFLPLTPIDEKKTK